MFGVINASTCTQQCPVTLNYDDIQVGLTSHQLRDGGETTGSGVVVSDGVVDSPDLTDDSSDVHVGQENAGMHEKVKGG